MRFGRPTGKPRQVLFRQEAALRFCRTLVGAMLVGFGVVPVGALAFALADVAQRARALSEGAYVRPAANLPDALRALSYEQYQRIRFKPERAHWRGQGLPIELAFFHRGMVFDQAVKINEVTADGAHEISYRADAFDFGSLAIDPKPLKGLGFAGFRVHYAINTPAVKDEVLVFLGASYFRALGRGQVYGLSARGLAVNTAEPSGEEFPRFVEFWIERPLPGAREFTVYALLDSPRVSGAYRFVLKPGSETTIDVTARLYARDKIAKLGIAPLSSMYLFGENQRSAHEDYRPEVHDSDGLAINTGDGQWLWHPLVNPRRLLVSSVATSNPRGFGLQQRDRRFSSYEELATRYDRRPSVWIEPRGQWGAGRVELVQLPTPDETNDNIMAFWVPERAPRPGQPYEIEYRMRWHKERPHRPPLLRVMQTRRGPDNLHRQENTIRFAVDFGAMSSALARGGEEEVSVASHVDGNATLLKSTLERGEARGDWRLSLLLRRLDQGQPVALRAYLLRHNKPVSETWNYILPPE